MLQMVIKRISRDLSSEACRIMRKVITRVIRSFSDNEKGNYKVLN